MTPRIPAVCWSLNVHRELWLQLVVSDMETRALDAVETSDFDGHRRRHVRELDACLRRYSLGIHGTTCALLLDVFLFVLSLRESLLPNECFH